MRRTTKIWLAATICLCLVRSAPAEIIDAVAATVDKDVVLYSSLMSQVGRELQSMRKTASSQEEYTAAANELMRQVLEESINTLLLAREARKIPQLEVTDKDLDQRLEVFQKDFDTPEAYIKAVGSVSEFRERQRQLMLAQRMGYSRMESFKAEVVISEDEINAYYQDHLTEFDKPERVLVRQIFLRVRDEADRPQAREKLEQLRQEILAGTSFEDLAKQHSQAPGAEDGGTIGWQQPSTAERPGDLIEPLEKAAFALPAGGISEVIDGPGGVHLLKVDKHEAAGEAGVNEVRLEIEQVLRENAAQKKYDTWIEDLRKRSRVRKFI